MTTPRYELMKSLLMLSISALCLPLTASAESFQGCSEGCTSDLLRQAEVAFSNGVRPIESELLGSWHESGFVRRERNGKVYAVSWNSSKPSNGMRVGYHITFSRAEGQTFLSESLPIHVAGSRANKEGRGAILHQTAEGICWKNEPFLSIQIDNECRLKYHSRRLICRQNVRDARTGQLSYVEYFEMYKVDQPSND